MTSYVKLNDLKIDERGRPNIIVIHKFYTKAPALTGKGIFYLEKIAVTDESIVPRDFKISIFYTQDKPPQFPRNCILRIQGLKVEAYKNTLDGRIWGAKYVDIIDPNNTAAIQNFDQGTQERLKELIAAFPFLFSETLLASQDNRCLSQLQLIKFGETQFKLSAVSEGVTQDLIGVIDDLWDYKLDPFSKTWPGFSIFITDNSLYPSTLRVFINCSYETMPSFSRYSVVYLRNVNVRKKNLVMEGYVQSGDDILDLNLKCGGSLSDIDTAKLCSLPEAEAARTRIDELMKWIRLNYEETAEIIELSQIFDIKWEPFNCKDAESLSGLVTEISLSSQCKANQNQEKFCSINEFDFELEAYSQDS